MPGKDLEKYQRGIWQAIGKPGVSSRLRLSNQMDMERLTKQYWKLICRLQGIR
jgi:hypothetical protein